MLDVSEYRYIVTTERDKIGSIVAGWITDEHELIGVSVLPQRDDKNTLTTHHQINVFGIPRIYEYQHHNCVNAKTEKITSLQKEGWKVVELTQNAQRYVSYVLRREIITD